MKTKLMAARNGFAQGWIELRHTFTSAQDLLNYLIPTVILLAVMFFTRNATVPGTDLSLDARTLPSMLGMGIVFGGLVVLASQLTVEREDGTLLRAKAVPHGMLGFLIGKITVVSGMMLITFALQLTSGLLLTDGATIGGPAAWFTLAWVLVIGLFATMPIGAIAGSLFSNPRNMGLIMLPLMGLIATSGIFYPITNFPLWLQWIAQVFPVYWLGLGMRSAMLPGELASVEFGQSWRHLETLGVLGAWAIAGLIIAPIVLRRMARRESGSTVAARREKALQRVN